MILVIIQARLSSSRLPKKILLPLPYDSKETALDQLINRLKKSQFSDKIVIATTEHPSDDALCEYMEKKNYHFYRGSLNDVLSRFHKSIELFPEVKHIVRITSDCPCLNPKWLDEIIQFHLKEKNDYTSNQIDIKKALGFSVEVFTKEALERANLEALQEFEREHVTPYFYMGEGRGKFKIKNHSFLPQENIFIRATLDTQEDYNFLCSLFDECQNTPLFSYQEIYNLVSKKKWLLALNQDIIQKKADQSLEEEIEILKLLAKKQGLKKASDLLNTIDITQYKI